MGGWGTILEFFRPNSALILLIYIYNKDGVPFWTENRRKIGEIKPQMPSSAAMIQDDDGEGRRHEDCAALPQLGDGACLRRLLWLGVVPVHSQVRLRADRDQPASRERRRHARGAVYHLQTI